jgi:hypothetical protein
MRGIGEGLVKISLQVVQINSETTSHISQKKKPPDPKREEGLSFLAVGYPEKLKVSLSF